MSSDAAPEPPAPHRRRRWPYVVGAIVVLVPLAFVGLRWATEPDDPSAFYEPPEDIEGDPGTILRDEEIDSPSDAMELHRVLYTSEDADGTAIAVSGVVAVPTGDAPDGGWPVAAWAHGTTGIVPGCAPSLSEHGGIQRVPGIDELIEAGRVVVVTDYPGLGTPGTHPYLIGESEGRAVLDSARAAKALLPDGDISSDTVVFGHSQGGHATLFAASLAPSYAPELDVLGAAPMAPPTELGLLMELDIDEPAGTLLTAMALSSWADLYPQADLKTITDTTARPLIAEIAADCVPETTLETLADAPAIVGLRAGFLSEDPRDAPGWKELLASSSPSRTEEVEVPLLVTQGLSDTIVRPEVTEAYVTAQCDLGAQVELHTYPGVGHFQLRTVAEPDVVAWMEDRFDGKAVEAGCPTSSG